ncbi:serine hydrolase [Arsukibacterium indicum]|uniref:beta-lactamase n=1 Tax=Arsukibacterium indicum TaxID=2848612 RepID=A0ABS6MQM4_9GAMM|nr:serine hydrolase [Arsukibacterium indicum]MBV2131093.1 class A beta-lactamase-related serine hydrolase [Arsukibacterium indicum]
MQYTDKVLIAGLIVLAFSCSVHSKGCANLDGDVCYELEPILVSSSQQYDVLQTVMKTPENFNVQVLYTQINRKPDNKVAFSHYQYGLNESRYFYPASTVKLPISILALQWLEQQNVAGLTKDTPMLTKSSRPGQTAALTDSTAESLLPSVGHYIRKILLVSDNDGYNRLYELLGQDYINNQLQQKGLSNTVINHRLSLPLAEPEQRHYNEIQFIDNSNQSILTLGARSSDTRYINSTTPTLGQAHIANGRLISSPMNFTEKNRFSIVDYTGVLKRLFFPESFDSEQLFKLNEQNRQFLIHYMGLSPSASDYPEYDEKEYPDNYAKFLLVGGDPQPIPEHLRIFNKTGWAYGHAIDGAYIVDTKNNVEFILVAVIYANENDILNDDNYQLNEIAKPFLRQLGQLIYQYELQRPRPVIPDLSHFRNHME